MVVLGGVEGEFAAAGAFFTKSYHRTSAQYLDQEESVKVGDPDNETTGRSCQADQPHELTAMRAGVQILERIPK